MLLKDFNDIKKLNKDCFKKFYGCAVSYDSSFLSISENEIAEKSYFDDKIYSDEGDSAIIKVDELEGMKLSRNKIEFFKAGELHGLSIERVKEYRFKVTFKAVSNGFTEEIYLSGIVGGPQFLFIHGFERLDSNFSKVKVKNFLVKNFNLFKESIEKCNNLLDSKLF